MALPERRQVQRDWLGHTVFAIVTAVCSIAGTAALLGTPLLSWATSIDTSIVRLQEARKNDDKRIEALQNFQTGVTDLLSKTSSSLAVIADHVKGMEDTLREKKK